MNLTLVMIDVSLVDGASVTGLLGGVAAVIKYGGSIVAIFARMEVYQKQQLENSQETNRRLEKVEKLLSNTVLTNE